MLHPEPCPQSRSKTLTPGANVLYSPTTHGKHPPEPRFVCVGMTPVNLIYVTFLFRARVSVTDVPRPRSEPCPNLGAKP